MQTDLECGTGTYPGTDVAKETLEIALGPEAKTFSVPNDRVGVGQLLPQLPAPGSCVVVLEPSGGFERIAIAELLQAGHSVALGCRISPRWGSIFDCVAGRYVLREQIAARFPGTG